LLDKAKDAILNLMSVVSSKFKLGVVPV